MSHKKIIRGTAEIFDRLKVKIEAVEITKKHIKFWVRERNSPKVFIRSSTPSDRRAEMNFECDVKRWLREVNLLTNGENYEYQPNS